MKRRLFHFAFLLIFISHWKICVRERRRVMERVGKTWGEGKGETSQTDRCSEGVCIHWRSSTSADRGHVDALYRPLPTGLCPDGSHLTARGDRTAPRRFPPVLLGAEPAFCEAGVEVACSFATLYLSNLGKDDLGGQGCLFSLISSCPPPNAMKLVLSDCWLQGQCVIPKCASGWHQHHWDTGGVELALSIPWKGMSRLGCDTLDSSKPPDHSCQMRAEIRWAHSPLAPSSVLRFTLHQLFIDLNYVGRTNAFLC